MARPLSKSDLNKTHTIMKEFSTTHYNTIIQLDKKNIAAEKIPQGVIAIPR